MRTGASAFRLGGSYCVDDNGTPYWRAAFRNAAFHSPFSVLSSAAARRKARLQTSLLQADLEAAVAAVADGFGKEVVLFLERRVDDAAFC